MHPPVARLIQPIEETDAARIAECLGLDSKKYHSVVAADATAYDEQMYTLDSQISDAERFKDVRKWNPKCIHCKERHDFEALIRIEVCVLFFKVIELLERFACEFVCLPESGLWKDHDTRLAIVPVDFVYESLY